MSQILAGLSYSLRFTRNKKHFRPLILNAYDKRKIHQILLAEK